jgi:phospholipase/carboxylesterase
VSLSLAHLVRRAAGKRPPLLLLLHGVGSNERSMAALAPRFDDRFLVLSARAPIELGADAYGWFHVTFTPGGSVIDVQEATEGWALLAHFIDEAVREYDADPSRVYVAGFSQGGIMALATLLTSPERVAGAVSMSGRLLPEVLPHAASAEALRGKRVLVVHGTVDGKLGVHLARWARERLAAFPLALTYRELPMGHVVSPESLALVSAWLSEALDAAPSRA